MNNNKIVWGKPPYYLDKNGKKVFQFTVVGERTVPIDKCDYHYDSN
ncbi:hypothetical protein N9R88_00355 [Candidatus Pelagibacter sp.]|nr:hypothetical protein [Candidatus Pelagibacter sp.]